MMKSYDIGDGNIMTLHIDPKYDDNIWNLYKVNRCDFCGRFVKRGLKYYTDHLVNNCPQNKPIIYTYNDKV